MRVPVTLAEAFGESFEALIAGFATEKKLLGSPEDLKSTRFLSRSVLPHVQRLSELFNRGDAPPAEGDAPKAPRSKAERLKRQAEALDPYWKKGSNPAHLRLAYFLYFMPSNLFRVASVWSELARLGFRWSANPGGEPLRAIEFGAGPASGACGIAAGEHFSPTGLPGTGNWALIEQDKAMLELGAEWAQAYFSSQGLGDWGTRTFHRQIDFKRGLLPDSAPVFHLWIMSYFLNELDEPPEKLAKMLIDSWKNHLAQEGIAILIEPALKMQSRKLLALRQALLEQMPEDFRLLLPCLGHQACGALAEEGDWCHEEVTWWRPPYFRIIDRLASLDRKTLPFSYLVVARSKRSIQEILPALQGFDSRSTQRLVSPSHAEGRDLEFFVCGAEGKRRARYRPEENVSGSGELERGSILLDPEIRGDAHSSRIQSVKKIG